RRRTGLSRTWHLGQADPRVRVRAGTVRARTVASPLVREIVVSPEFTVRGNMIPKRRLLTPQKGGKALRSPAEDNLPCGVACPISDRECVPDWDMGPRSPNWHPNRSPVGVMSVYGLCFFLIKSRLLSSRPWRDSLSRRATALSCTRGPRRYCRRNRR